MNATQSFTNNFYGPIIKDGVAVNKTVGINSPNENKQNLNSNKISNSMGRAIATSSFNNSNNNNNLIQNTESVESSNNTNALNNGINNTAANCILTL